MWVSLVLPAHGPGPIGDRTRLTCAHSARASSRDPWTRLAKSLAQPDHLHHRAPAAPVLRALPDPDPVRPIRTGGAGTGTDRAIVGRQRRHEIPPLRGGGPGSSRPAPSSLRTLASDKPRISAPARSPADALAHPSHQGGATGRARPGVRLENPLVIRGPRGELVYLGDRVLRPSSRPVRGRVEVGFEDRLGHQYPTTPERSGPPWWGYPDCGPCRSPWGSACGAPARA